MGHVLCHEASYWLRGYPMGSKAIQVIGQDVPSAAVQYHLSSQQRYQSGVLVADSQPPKRKSQLYQSQNYNGLKIIHLKKLSLEYEKNSYLSMKVWQNTTTLGRCVLSNVNITHIRDFS